MTDQMIDAEAMVADSLRSLLKVIEECATFNDPAGALDRIREHAEASRALMTEYDHR